MVHRTSFAIILLACFLTTSAIPPPAEPDSLTNASIISDKDLPKQGWTSQPNGRGTIDIIWSCAITLTLCSWSVLCINVPAPNDSQATIVKRKLWLTALGFLGPELIFQIALGQWLSAYQSVKDFHASGRRDWTMRHAFFADMGGFVLKTKDWTAFPIDAKQLHYLVKKRYVKYPSIDLRTIKDKNKVDSALRLITLFQIFWFVINVSARAAQHLAITCIELTTAAFIICSVGTSFCWAYKPADVFIPVIIYTDTSLQDILLQAGNQACKPYSRTPLDFVSRREWAWSLYWSNWINILRNFNVKYIQFDSGKRPIQQFGNAQSLELPGSTVYIFLGMTFAYSSVFVCGWNYAFATRVEQHLWRAASITVIACVLGYWFATEIAFSVYPAIRRSMASNTFRLKVQESLPTPLSDVRRTSFRRMIAKTASAMRNNSIQKDPDLDVPLKAMIPVHIFGFFYCHARAYLFIEDIIELRSLPASAYATVNWSNLVPHF